MAAPIPHQLLIDGYLAHMFGPQDVEEHHATLLGRPLQTIECLPINANIFYAAPPPGPVTDQPGLALDYTIRDTGTVIQQEIWAPRKASDAHRYVHQLRPPIFFAHNTGEGLGLPLNKAAGGDCACLRGADQAAPVGPGVHAQIRINWPGYRELNWNEQIMTQMQQPPRPISLGTFAKYVAGRVKKFMQDARTETCNDDERWRIGEHGIKPCQIILIGAVQVSQGSWMPILQLNDKFTNNVLGSLDLNEAVFGTSTSISG